MSDKRIRKLERLAATGDEKARQNLVKEKWRSGLRKRKDGYLTYIYPEVYAPSHGESHAPVFPEQCPCCDGEAVETFVFPHGGPKKPELVSWFKPAVYVCGGEYKSKPQIQNHTDKWWGTCPVGREFLKGAKK